MKVPFTSCYEEYLERWDRLASRIDSGIENNDRYEQEFAKLFNLATTTFCWRDIEPESGKMRFAEGSPEIFRRPPPDRVVNFGRKYGISLKGQPLLADSWHPKWAVGTQEEVKRLYVGYFEKVAERYGKKFAIWDVVNEAFLSIAAPFDPAVRPERPGRFPWILR